MQIKWATSWDLKNLKGIIYLVINTINNKVYIGKTINTFNERYQNSDTWYEYIDNHLLKNSIKKYGYKNFKIRILEYGISDDIYLCWIETFYIRLFNSLKPNGFNIKENHFSHYLYKRKKITLLRDKDENLFFIKNLKEFCKIKQINYKRIIEIITKEKLHYDGYHLDYFTLNECKIIDTYYKYRNKVFFLRDENENLIKISNIGKFSRENKIHKDKIRKILSGEFLQYKGFHLPSLELKYIPTKTGKPFDFDTIYGEKIYVKNLRQYCKYNNLNYDSMKRLRSGRCNKYGIFLNKNGKD